MPQSRFPSPGTPFPNYLLDTLMPTLKDTEWRLLCVVVRATIGWKAAASGGRKDCDWLTHSQLRKRTGRSSEAICKALDVLLRQGLLEVRDELGVLLATPQARRNCRGKLFFQLGHAALEGAGDADEQTGRRISETGTGISKNETCVSISEITKAKTTKEKDYKKTPDGVRANGAARVDKPGDKQTCGESMRRGKRTQEQPNPDVRRFLEAYRQMFARRSAQNEPPPISWGKDGRLVKGLLAQYGYDRLVELLERFFQSEDAWAKKRGYALACFLTLLPQLLMDPSASKGSRRSARATPLAPHGPEAQPWRKAADLPVSNASLFERYPALARKVRDQPP